MSCVKSRRQEEIVEDEGERGDGGASNRVLDRVTPREKDWTDASRQGAFGFRHVARSTSNSAEKDALYMLYARNRLNA